MKKATLLIVILSLIILIAFIVPSIYSKVLKSVYPIRYSEYVDKYSAKYDIDKEWIYALIKAESNFNGDSISRKRSNRTYATS